MNLIGSRRIKQLYPDFRNVDKSDFDYVGTGKSGNGIEYHDIPALRSVEINGDVMLTLKLSHVFWGRNQRKHLYDIQFLIEKGCVVIPELFDMLFSFWERLFGNRTMPDFTKTYEQFFDDYVEHSVDHDTIHHALTPNPAFKTILKNDGTVDICEEKFNALTYEHRLNVIREECTVLVYERYYVRGIFEKHYKTYYSEMLLRLLSNLSPLWMAVFIAKNHKKLLTINNLKNDWKRVNQRINVLLRERGN